MNNIEKIFIDLDDEITFIIERIRNSRNQRVLVIVPDRARLISSIVSLKLLKRYCTKVDKELIIVTTDELGLSLSTKAGVVTVKKVSDIDEVMWERAKTRLAEEKLAMEEKANGKKAKSPLLNTGVTEEGIEPDPVSSTQKKSTDPALEKGVLAAGAVVGARELAKEGLEKDEEQDLKQKSGEEILNTEESEIIEQELNDNEVDDLEKEELKSEEPDLEKDENAIDDDSQTEPEIEEANVEKEDEKLSSNSDLESKPVIVEEKPEDKIRVIKGFSFMPGGDISKVAVASSVSLASNTGTISGPGSVAGASALTGVSATSLDPSKPINKDSESTPNSDDYSKSNETDKAKVARAVVAGAAIAKNQSNYASKKYKPANSSFVVGRDISGVEFKKNKLRTKLDSRSTNRQTTKSGGKAKLPKPPKLNIPIKNKKFLAIGGVVVVLLMAFIYFIVPKVELNISVGSKTITATQEIKADPNINEINVETSSIPAKITEVIVSGSKSATATGKIQTGEVARGTVTLFNKTTADIKLASGTRLVAGDKAFLTEVEVTVPKKDEDFGTFGTKDVGVRASTFGTTYNLNEGTDFSVDGYNRADQLLGRNFKSFTGGTNTEKTVVSQQDFDKARDELITELQPKAIEEVKTQLGDDRFFLEDQIKFEVTEAISDPVVGAEGESFDISVTGKATVTSFAKSDLDEFSNALLETMAKDGFVIDEESIKVTSNYLRSEGAVLIVNLQVEAVSYQEFDEEAILESIKGKSHRKASEILESNEAIQDFELIITPKWLIGPFKHIPRNTDKITMKVGFVEVESEEPAPTEETPAS